MVSLSHRVFLVLKFAPRASSLSEKLRPEKTGTQGQASHQSRGKIASKVIVSQCLSQLNMSVDHVSGNPATLPW
jgi:hypothetical protein